MNRWAMKVCLILVAILMPATWRPLRAQQATSPDPGAIEKHSTDTLQYLDLQQKLEELRRQAADKSKKTAQSASAKPNETGAKFLLRRVIVNASELLTPPEIQGVLAQYEGREVTMADLTRLTAAFNELYARKGYATARAILPAQQITDGEVKVTLVEGHIGRVSIANRTRTEDIYILDSVRLQPGQLLRVDQLQRRLLFLNSTSDIKVKAVLQPGASFGTSDVDLQVEEPPNQRTMLSFDNAGRNGVGNDRVGFVERYGSLMGLRDPLTVGTYWATGTVDTFASYNLPLDSWGTRWGVNYDYSRIRIVSGPDAGFGISGTSMDSGLRLSQPLMVRRRLLWSAALQADFIDSRLQSQNIPLTDTHVESSGLATDAQFFDHQGVWSTNHTFTWGVHDLGGTHHFLKYNASIIRVQNLPGEVVGLLRVTGQTNDLAYLPPVEQFQVGGLATVRGYPEGRQIGDRGYSGTAELQLPAPFEHRRVGGSSLGNKLKEALFFDTGAVYDSYNSFNRPPGDDRYLTSVGTGFMLNLSKFFSGRVDVGFPLRNTEGIPHWRLHFYLQSGPPLAGLLRKAARVAEAHTNPPDAD
jgi:hemolysin activation/secretion protein